MEPIEVNVMATLATAMYCQLNILMNDTSTDGVSDFSVEVTYDKDPDGFFVDGICGYIETNRGGKETTLKFDIMDMSPYDDILFTITQDLDGSISEQDAKEAARLLMYEPSVNVFMDHGKRRMYYRWDTELWMNIDDLDDELYKNKRTLDAVAQDIINDILAKVESTDLEEYI